jgi:hypothetical protein
MLVKSFRHPDLRLPIPAAPIFGRFEPAEWRPGLNARILSFSSQRANCSNPGSCLAGWNKAAAISSLHADRAGMVGWPTPMPPLTRRAG